MEIWEWVLLVVIGGPFLVLGAVMLAVMWVFVGWLIVSAVKAALGMEVIDRES